MVEKDIAVKRADEEKSFVEGFGLCSGGNGGNPGVVDIKNGRITRIRPLHYDAKYSAEEFNPWRLEARGKVFQPTMKSLLPPFSLVYKKRLYSPNRILYPLRRVDWDPNGERNPQNRGKSRFVRISWDEAVEIVVSEIKRVHKKYGPYAILCQADVVFDFLSFWEVIRYKPEIRTAGKGGTGGRNMYGEWNPG
jgi:anaerobic selenocysteine-containing dehydrogenase